MERGRVKRVGYRKSRNGCARCKRRRVKCDENVPCNACVRHQESCSLETTADQTRDTRVTCEGSTLTRGAQSAVPSDLDMRWSHASPSGSSGVNQSLFPSDDGMDGLECWISNAELIFHYANVASHSLLVFSKDLTTTFQVIVPREAISHSYLLRAIMAFSAYHLAHLSADKRPYYNLLAGIHQGHAIKGLREALEDPITEETCHSLYLASIFLTINKFAAFPNCAHGLDGCRNLIDSLAEIFHLIYGMSAILRSSEEAIRHGSFKEMFTQVDNELEPGEEASVFCQRLSALQTEILSAALDDTTKQDLLGAVQTLKSCFLDASRRVIKKSPTEMRVIFAWPELIPRRFPDLIKECHPVALVVVAYYGCLISASSEDYWFLQGWPKPLKGFILEKLKNSAWAEVAQWPLYRIKNRGE